MNKKFIIPIIGVIGVIAFVLINFEESEIMEVEDALNKEVDLVEETIPEIQEKLDEIEKSNLENEYTPKEREWITSGPFQIDRSEYLLGEKIFVRIGGLDLQEKGQIVFLKPKNSTHYEVYWSIPFDGMDKPAFNYYLEPELSSKRNICTPEDLVGDWRVVFRGTTYPNIEFKVTEEILTGEEKNYQPVC